jgi:hypothetical protein
MPTIAKNRIVRSVAPNSAIADLTSVLSSAISYNQGDLLYFDDALNLVKPIAADANGATFLGIAQQSVVSGVPKPVYQGTAVDASVAIEGLAGPAYGVEAKMKLKSGDVFNPGDLVYGTAVDAQTVSSAGTNAIGIYVGSTVTAASGSEGVVRLGLRFRTSGLVL